MSIEVITFLFICLMLLSIMSGYYMGPALGAVGFIFGYIVLNPTITNEIMYGRVYELMLNYSLLAMPLFVFMGEILARTGITDSLYGALHLLLGRFRGGLAIGTVLFGTILAACLGVITASVSMMTIIGLGAMVDRGYDKSFAAGSICAGGTLGILIPPSIMFVIYGPLASVSVGKLFMGAIFPGLMLSLMYCIYIAVRAHLQPGLAPPVSEAEYHSVPSKDKFLLLIKSMLPPIVLILAVLGAIFTGIAPPTEAAALGAFASVVLAISYKKLTLSFLKEASRDTMRIISFGFFIGLVAYGSIGVFMRMGCSDVIANLILSTPGGRWGAFSVIMGTAFILGMFMDWLPIMFILIPVITPLVPQLGFDTLWFGMMLCICLQIGLMTPPFAVALFVCKGSADKRIGITIADIIKGMIPYICIMILALIILIIFPQIITWLPGRMITTWT